MKSRLRIIAIITMIFCLITVYKRNKYYSFSEITSGRYDAVCYVKSKDKLYERDVVLDNFKDNKYKLYESKNISTRHISLECFDINHTVLFTLTILTDDIISIEFDNKIVYYTKVK